MRFVTSMGKKYEEVEIAMCGEFYTVIPCPELTVPNFRLEEGEIFAVLKPAHTQEDE